MSLEALPNFTHAIMTAKGEAYEKLLEVGDISASTSTSVRVAFRSRSDALLASLTLRHKHLHADILDSFLDLLHHPEFRLDEVSFTKAEDISSHISSQWREIAHRRSYGSSRSHAGYQLRIPDFILELVAQQLSSERTSFKKLMEKITARRSRSLGPTACSREEDLRNMSLVHRSWTGPAQRALHKRVDVRGIMNLRTLLRSPYVGPRIKEVCFVCPDLMPNLSERSDAEFADMARLLSSFLKSAPNVHSLCLRITVSKGSSDSSRFRSLTRGLVGLHCLENLWFIQDGSHDIPAQWMPELCSALSNLPQLKVLWLKSFSNSRKAEVTDAAPTTALNSTRHPNVMDTISPPPRLASISFTAFRCSQIPGILTWLFSAHTLKGIGFMLDNLKGTPPAPLLVALQPVLPSLGSLRIGLSPYGSRDVVNEQLSKCHNLRYLSITFRGSHGLGLNYPQTLEVLHLHNTSRWPSQDSDIVAELGNKPLPNLRILRLTEVIVTISGQIEPATFAEDGSSIPGVSEMCRNRGIALYCENSFYPFDADEELSSVSPS